MFSQAKIPAFTNWLSTWNAAELFHRLKPLETSMSSYLETSAVFPTYVKKNALFKLASVYVTIVKLDIF